MCTIDGDQPDVYVANTRRARREHVCTECRRTIRSGERYSLARALYDGGWDIYKTCEHCRVGQEWLVDVCNGFQHAGLEEDVDEHAREIWESRFGLLRLKVGIRRKWRAFAGDGLLRVPPMPRVPDEMRA